MKQTLKATTKAAEEFANRLEAIGAGVCSAVNECDVKLRRQINNSLAFDPLCCNKKIQAKRVAEAFEKMDKQQQERLTGDLKAMSEGMRQFQKAWGERYNLKNLQENLKR